MESVISNKIILGKRGLIMRLPHFSKHILSVLVIILVIFSGINVISFSEVTSSRDDNKISGKNRASGFDRWKTNWEMTLDMGGEQQGVDIRDGETIYLTNKNGNITKRKADTGELLWTGKFGNYGFDVAFDSKNNFAVVGRSYEEAPSYIGHWYMEYYNGKTNKTIWSGFLNYQGITCGAFACTFDSEDKLIIVGKTVAGGGGTDDRCSVVKYHPNNGTEIWATHDTPAFDWSVGYYDVCTDSQDNIIACGRQQGSPYAARIRKVDKNGTILWSKDPSTSYSCCYSVGVDSNDNVLTGIFDEISLTTDLIKYSPDGTILWTKNDLGVNVSLRPGARSIFSYGENNWFVGGSAYDSESDIMFYLLNETGGIIDIKRINVGENEWLRCLSFDRLNRKVGLLGGNQSKVYCSVLTYNDFAVNSIQLLKQGIETTTIFSQLAPYTLKVRILDTISDVDLGIVRVSLEPETNVHLLWSRSSGKFSEHSDPHNYITLEPSSSVVYDHDGIWEIYFNFTINWNYPDEELSSVSVFATSAVLNSALHNVSEIYKVENDLTFTGSLSVKKIDNIAINENDTIKGGSLLKWSGLTTVYQGTTDVYPRPETYDVSVWDGHGNSWTDSPNASEEFYIETTTSLTSNMIGEKYTVNITGIPSTSDASNVKFTIKIDGGEVTFKNLAPNNSTWQRTKKVKISATIIDEGGSYVDGESIQQTFSTDNGTTWEVWKNIYGVDSGIEVYAEDVITLKEGINNLVKWKAADTLGNGPTESSQIRVLVDTETIDFSNFNPDNSIVSYSSTVNVNMTISDSISGVNGSSIQFAISTDGGDIWSQWRSVEGYDNGKKVEISREIKFENGTDNRIKWRASDLAGNGPTESAVYPIKVDTWLSNKLKVRLQSPRNASIIPQSSIKLTWLLQDLSITGVTYDIYFDNVTPPEKIKKADLDGETLVVEKLIDKEIYYWKVIPKVGVIEGTCISGIWSVKYDKDAKIPSVNLVSPENEEVFYKDSIELSWEPIISSGSGSVSDWRYIVYFGEDNPPTEIIEEYYDSTTLIIDGVSHGKTYYWCIVPISEQKIYGQYAKTINSFSVDLQSFGISIEPIDDLQIERGKSSQILVKIKNIGKPIDTYRLSLKTGNLGDLVTISGSSEVTIQPDNTSTIIIYIVTTNKTKIDDYEVILTAKSLSAEYVESNVAAEENFTIKVIAPKKQSPKDDPDDGLNALILGSIISVIIIIVILILLWFLMLKKKPQATEDSESKYSEHYQSDSLQPGETMKPISPLVSSLDLHTKIREPGFGSDQPRSQPQNLESMQLQGPASPSGPPPAPPATPPLPQMMMRSQTPSSPPYGPPASNVAYSQPVFPQNAQTSKNTPPLPPKPIPPGPTHYAPNQNMTSPRNVPENRKNVQNNSD